MRKDLLQVLAFSHRYFHAHWTIQKGTASSLYHILLDLPMYTATAPGTTMD